jgi:hypothetical protein
MLTKSSRVAKSTPAADTIGQPQAATKSVIEAATKNLPKSAIALSFILVAFASAPSASAQKLSPQITATFNQYVSAAESRDAEKVATSDNFIAVDAQPELQSRQTYAELQSGQVFIERTHSDAPVKPAPGSLIHDWTAIIFVPGVTLPQTLAALQDYDRDAAYYAPQVTRSKLLAHDGDHFHVALRLQQKYVFTVVLDTEYDIRYASLDATHVTSQSRSTNIAEVENVGTPREHEVAPAEDHGFLWRLNSYWHFYAAHGGVYIQCNAISLTRDAPIGLGPLVAPFVENIPRDSLRFTLTATREALLKKYRPESNSRP